MPRAWCALRDLPGHIRYTTTEVPRGARAKLVARDGVVLIPKRGADASRRPSAPDDDHVPLDVHLAPLDGAQIVLHNVDDGARQVPPDVHGTWHQLKESNSVLDAEPSENAEIQEGLAESGARWSRSENGRDSIHLSEIRDGQAIVLTGPVERLTARGAEWARVQMRGRASMGSALDKSGEHSIIALGKFVG